MFGDRRNTDDDNHHGQTRNHIFYSGKDTSKQQPENVHKYAHKRSFNGLETQTECQVSLVSSRIESSLGKYRKAIGFGNLDFL